MGECILITGGAGYIGSHTTLILLKAGFDVIVLDNLCNSSVESINRVTKLAGRAPKFLKGDVGDYSILNDIFKNNCISAVFHFAGYKSVDESITTNCVL